MKDILREIFDGEYDITPKRDKTQQELDEKLCAEWDKVQKMFGDEFIDRLFELEGEKEGWRAFHYYREGFRLGVRLMLEALGV
ncbi:MAG: hypothetical protein HFF46_05510 [Lawsonibacter sp.]|jgi:hypothetical protein|nr:hypothetical protein [Lawsonibacter sp.]